MLHPDYNYFPEPEEIKPHAMAFAQVMFAHARLEAEVRALQGAIADDWTFGEQRANQWRTRERASRVLELIKTKLKGDVKEAESIAETLTRAINPCEQRNHLAHGEWWAFNPQTAEIIVRGGIRWDDEDHPPRHETYTASQIEALAGSLTALKDELVIHRRSIEAHRGIVPSDVD